jgi:hypothetical protein
MESRSTKFLARDENGDAKGIIYCTVDGPPSLVEIITDFTASDAEDSVVATNYSQISITLYDTQKRGKNSITLVPITTPFAPLSLTVSGY